MNDEFAEPIFWQIMNLINHDWADFHNKVSE